jgi:anti-sigma factor RsiW
MTQSSSGSRPTNAELVAYIDGELSAERKASIDSWINNDRELQVKLLALVRGERLYREAFELILANAPQKRLAQMLAALPEYGANTTGQKKSPLFYPTPPQRRPRVLGLVAGLLLFLVGAAADRFLPELLEAVGINIDQESDEDWRKTVAESISLYTPETVAFAQNDPSLIERELAAVGSKLQLPLTLDRVSLPDLSLRRSQLLDYDEKSLGQLIYLGQQGRIVALCVYADGQSDAAQKTEQRSGMNVVYWSSRDHAFMLVGRTTVSELQRLANQISRQLAL